MKKTEIEKSLKRFLKNKISYSFSLLVAFLINGEISASAEPIHENSQASEKSLLNKIKREREKVKKKIANKEKIMKKYSIEFEQLLKKGDFYAKPFFPSTQIFFNFKYDNNALKADRTEAEHKKNLDAIQKHFFPTEKSGTAMALQKLITADGVVVDNKLTKEKYEVGANITVIEPSTPKLRPEVKVSVSPPNVTLGELPKTFVPTSPKIIDINVNAPDTPTISFGAPSINVQQLNPIEKIELPPVVIPTPESPKEKHIQITTPEVPKTFTLKAVPVPKTPAAPSVTVPDIPQFSIEVRQASGDPRVYIDFSRGEHAPIHMVSLTGGEFNLKRPHYPDNKYVGPLYSYNPKGGIGPEGTFETPEMWEYYYSNYSGSSLIGGLPSEYDGPEEHKLPAFTTPGVTEWADLNRPSTAPGRGYRPQAGFLKLYTSPGSTMLNNANMLYTRNVENSKIYVGELAHLQLAIVHNPNDPPKPDGTAMEEHEWTMDKLMFAGQRRKLKHVVRNLPNKDSIMNAYDDAGKNINISSKSFETSFPTYPYTDWETTADSFRYTYLTSGLTVIEGGNTSLTNFYHPTSGGAPIGTVPKGAVINTGEVIFQPSKEDNKYYQKYTQTFLISEFSDMSHRVLYNGPTGSIKTYTQLASFYTSANEYYGQEYDQTTHAYTSNILGNPVSMVNRGTLEMYGENSTGIFFRTGARADLLFADENFAFNETTGTVTAGDYKPIKLFGDKSIGLFGGPDYKKYSIYNGWGTSIYVSGDPEEESPGVTKIITGSRAGETIGHLAIDIGAPGKGNELFTTNNTLNNGKGTNGEQIVNLDINPSGTSDLIEGSFGIINPGKMNLTSHQIRIYDKTVDSVGVHPSGDETLKLGSGEILLKDGTKNTGVLILESIGQDANGINKTFGKGGVESKGTITLDGGINNMAIYGKGGSHTKIQKIKAIDPKDSLMIYGEAGANLQVLDTDVNASIGNNPTKVNNNNTGMAFATGTGTKIVVGADVAETPLTTPSAPTINIIGKKQDDSEHYVGFGLMAAGGGKIVARNNNIKVKDGAIVAAAIDNGSHVDLTGSTIEYDGKGYALYSDGDGKIDLSGTKVILKGNSIAYDLDLTPGVSSPMKLSTDTRIHVDSDDAIIFNLKNVTDLSTTKLEDRITKSAGSGLPTGTTITNLITAGPNGQKYKIAAKDGGDLDIGDLDKSGVDPNTGTQAQKDGYFFYNRFLVQRMNAKATGKKILANLTNSQASKFNNQVIGLEMSSSKLATDNKDASINLVNSKIEAARIDSGQGAIGALINYGQVTLDGSSSIKAQMTGSQTNKGAIGVYAVNGSNVENSGTIEVGGENGIGILGLTNRVDSSGNIVSNEFGAKPGEGTITVSNKKDIKALGLSGIGIYVNNNNSANITDAKAINETSGNIEVGVSDDQNTAVGIYGVKSTISNTGKITVGKDSVGIYGTEGSNIDKLGTINLDENSIAVMVDKTSNLDPSITDFSLSKVGNTTGQIGFYYNGSGSENRTLPVNISSKDLVKAISIYVKDMSITSTGTLKVGQEGVGIYINSDKTQKTAKNTGTIDLLTDKTGSVGMYAQNGTIHNTGTIDVNGKNQIGMFIKGNNSFAVNTGSINLNKDNGIAIYGSDVDNFEISGAGIVFNGVSGIGNFAEKSKAKITSSYTFNHSNKNGSILVFGKDSEVETVGSGTTLTVDGLSTELLGKKTIGIYLEKDTTGSIYKGDGKIEVQGKAIGIYSKGNNKLDLNLKSKDENSIGAYLTGGSEELKGTVNPASDSIGIYGTGGEIKTKGLNLALGSGNDIGTGMYVTDAAFINGSDINISNNSSTKKNVGIHYSKGTATNQVINKAKINLNSNNLIAIYAAGGIDLKNSFEINNGTGKDETIGAFVSDNSSYTSVGKIDLKGNKNMGIHVKSGKGVNEGDIDISSASSDISIGMLSQSDLGEISDVINKNKINLKDKAIGMYVTGTGVSKGTNLGTISVDSKEAAGAYIEGSTNSFDGSAGTIDVTQSGGLGLYLKNTGANKIKLGNLNLASKSIAVYADNSKVDFEVKTDNFTKEVALVAKGTTNISGNIFAGTGSIGVYVQDNKVVFNGANITTKVNTATDTSVGIFLDKGVGLYTINNVNVNAKNGVGVYLGNDTSSGANLTFSGVVTTEEGAGIYVPENTTLTTKDVILNVDKGTGVYVSKGTANLGVSDELKINFGADGGVGVYNEGGTLNLGDKITVTGAGSLAATSDGSLESAGKLNIGEGSSGLFGKYSSATTGLETLKNAVNGEMNATSGGIGIVAIKGATLPTGSVHIENDGLITASGKSSDNKNSSIGIYTDIADVNNNGQIKVGSNGIGIYSKYNGKPISVNNKLIDMTDKDGIGIYLKGETKGLTNTDIKSSGNGTGNIGILMEDTLGVGGTPNTLNVGSVSLGNGSIGVLASNEATASTFPTTLEGKIKVGNSSTTKSSIGVVARKGTNLTISNSANTEITSGSKGIGAYAEGTNTNLTVLDTSKIKVGEGGTYLYSKGANLTFTGNIDANNRIGIAADGGTLNAVGITSISVSKGGVGAYIKNAAPSLGTTIVTVNDGTDSKKSTGLYFDNVPNIGTIPTVNQIGNNSIGAILNKSKGTAPGTVITGGKKKIGFYIENNSELTLTGITKVSGDENIAIYGKNSKIVTNDIEVLTTTPSAGTSIGIHMDNSSLEINGNLKVENGSDGVHAKGLSANKSIKLAGSLDVKDSALGIYASGDGTGFVETGAITVANSSTGLYTKGANTKVNGNIVVGKNSSIGILSDGNGSINHSGSMTIGNERSVGIYKKSGKGSIITSANNWVVGDKGYGIFNRGENADITNKAQMTLGKSAVGIYSSGSNKVINSGNIIVGETDVNGNARDITKHQNSVGIYLTNGSTLENSATITVNKAFSVGVFGSEKASDGKVTEFINRGTINVDNGGTGIIVRDDARAINESGATINIGTGTSNDATSVGMAAYSGGEIINRGKIVVGQGIGMLVGDGGTLDNQGKIYANGGFGISGDGLILNKGEIILGGGKDVKITGVPSVKVGAVVIDPSDPKGPVTIDGSYVSIGGTINAGNTPIILDGAYVDITKNVPFLSTSASAIGEVKILPNFTLTGDGISYKIENFINVSSDLLTKGSTDITPIISPLFTYKKSGKDLILVKRPYADLASMAPQSLNIFKGIDNILTASKGLGRDAEVIKKMNHYLTGIEVEKGTELFEKEAGKQLAQTIGNQYSTIQERSKTVNQSFNSSFSELESSYSPTKDSDKYSVIYTAGTFKDPTVGITDYDYNVKGLLYMKEKDSIEYMEKYGLSLGFATSNFYFKDPGKSFEKIYSIKAGVHNVKTLSEKNKVTLLTKLEGNYNRHSMNRRIVIPDNDLKKNNTIIQNDAKYNSYSANLSNKLTKEIYSDHESQVDLYTNFDLEYGRLGAFNEKGGKNGGLELSVKDKNQVKSNVGVGLKGSHKIHLKDDVALKVGGEVGYSHEVVNTLKSNETRITNGKAGYTNLINSEKDGGKLSAKMQLSLEKVNQYGTTFEVEASKPISNKEGLSLKGSIRFNYKF